MSCEANKMSKAGFCRTCFSSTNLESIFNGSFDPNFDSEKITNDLFVTTGMKIEKDDALSLLICTDCNIFIQKSISFRKKCEETNEKLLKLREDIEKQQAEIDSAMHSEDSLLDKLDTDNYVEMEGTFNEFIAKAKDIIFTNKKKQIKADLSFIQIDKVKEENGPQQCQRCPKVFATTTAFLRHQRIHNTVKGICQYCGKALKDERALLVHYKAMHGHEKTDKCRFCDYRGSRPELVKIHERTHTGEKPYVCAQCGVGFHRKSSYLTHTPLHLPEKTVQCDQCPAMFKSVTLMHIHKSNSHRRRQKAGNIVSNIWIK